MTNLTYLDARALLAKPARKGHKYGAKAVTIDGHRFASQAEGRRYSLLKLRERAGEIRDIELQPKFPLLGGGLPVLIRSEGFPKGRRAVYRADFRYAEVATGNVHVIDVKGHDTEASRLRRALVEAIYGITVEVVR